MIEIGSVWDGDFKTKVLESIKPVLVDFWADWCPPCRKVAPILEGVVQKYPDSFTLVKLNVDDSPRTSTEYKILNIPTMILFSGGNEIARTIGYMPEEKVIEFLSAHIALKE
ncbi:MAG: thioredoxin [bacterium]